jgi:hypothetical protein
LAGVGADNVTVDTSLQIANAYPEITSIVINNGDTIGLSPNTTTKITVYAVLRDFNGEDDLDSIITSRFFDISSSTYAGADDNNNHYTNNTCSMDKNYGNEYEANATCTFDLEYYSNNATWNFSMQINDSLATTDLEGNTTIVNALFALSLPDFIDYGLINSTTVSDEVTATVINVGNARVNLSLSGYGATIADGLAMNCSFGAVQNISVMHEKYNLTVSNTDDLSLDSFIGNYTNLTTSVSVKNFELDYRTNDTDPFIEEVNSTYWRIYVPLGVAGNCSGHIIFGAVQFPD